MKADTKFGYWSVVASVSGWQMGQEYSRPKFVAETAIPQDLTALSIGQLIELGNLKEGVNIAFEVCRIILGLSPTQVHNARAVDVVRFVGWVYGEVRKINELFERSQSKPTPQEVQAGVKNLSFGLFGLLDWYAKRMGITNHDEVLGVPWLRIYRCLDMDNKTNQFNRKLSEVYNNEYKRKSKANLR